MFLQKKDNNEYELVCEDITELEKFSITFPSSKTNIEEPKADENKPTIDDGFSVVCGRIKIPPCDDLMSREQVKALMLKHYSLKTTNNYLGVLKHFQFECISPKSFREYKDKYFEYFSKHNQTKRDKFKIFWRFVDKFCS